MSIKIKLFTFLIIAGTIIVAICAIFYFYLASIYITESVINHIKTIADSKELEINLFLDSQKENIEIAATHSELSNQELKVIRDINKDFYEVFVLNSQGYIIASTDESKIGLNRSQDAYFLNARIDTYIKPAYYSQATNSNSIAVATPHNQGVLVARINLDSLNKIIERRIGLGETGESLLAIFDNSRGLQFFSQRRFKEDVAISEESAVPMRSALRGEENVFVSAHDYRNQHVLAATRFIDEVKMGLVVKIDRKEAFQELRFLLLYLILFSLVFIIIFYFLAYFFSKRISKPINNLKNGLLVVKKGNLDYKVGTNSKDEIGMLARSFDEMTFEIKKSRAEVDKKVKEQTGDIIKKQTLLEEQQKAVLNILEDVEDEKDNVVKERDKVDTILHSIGDGVFVVDSDFRITMFNKIAADICGCLVKESFGKRYDKVLKFVYEKDGRVNNEFIKKAIATGEIQEMANHTLLIRPDGKKIPVADSAAPLKDKDGKVIGCVVVFRDVTEEREIDKMKSEFISVASHQLHTPLTGIKWFLELLLTGKAGKLSAKQKDFLQQVFSSNERMIALVGDLLSVSRIETGRKFNIEKKMTDMVAIVNQVIIDNIALAKEKEIKIVKCTGAPKEFNFLVDPSKIEQVFHNLISNAIKYSKKGGKVEIGCDHKKKDKVIFYVKDYGFGITKRQQKKVFQKFFRAENILTKETDGTGLGLYIAKSIVEAHGGKIWFESEENKGTTFYFSLSMSKK